MHEGTLSSSVDFYAEMEYNVFSFRESKIYDYTEENAYVELPQVDSMMAIGITYGDYEDGYYLEPSWQVITRPQYYVMSDDGDFPDATPQQYANYVADYYYQICVYFGKWPYGCTMYHGLGEF